jgi:hypothetical protein
MSRDLTPRGQSDVRCSGGDEFDHPGSRSVWRKDREQHGGVRLHDNAIEWGLRIVAVYNGGRREDHQRLLLSLGQPICVNCSAGSRKSRSTLLNDSTTKGYIIGG